MQDIGSTSQQAQLKLFFWFGLVWKLWLSTSLLVQPMTPRKVHYPQHKEGRDGAVIKPPQESLDTTASDVILLKIIENY